MHESSLLSIILAERITKKGYTVARIIQKIIIKSEDGSSYQIQ